MIEDLPVLTPDAARRVRTLERCHQRFRPPQTRHTLERAAFGAFCLLYLAAVALDVARVVIR